MSSSKSKKASAEPKLSVEAKKFYLYSKVYRFLAFVALFIGVVVCWLIYDKASGGDYSIILERPAIIFNLFIPFIPAAMLTSISQSKRKKFLKAAEKDGFDIKGLRKSRHLYSHNKVKQS